MGLEDFVIGRAAQLVHGDVVHVHRLNAEERPGMMWMWMECTALIDLVWMLPLLIKTLPLCYLRVWMCRVPLAHWLFANSEGDVVSQIVFG